MHASHPSLLIACVLALLLLSGLASVPAAPAGAPPLQLPPTFTPTPTPRPGGGGGGGGTIGPGASFGDPHLTTLDGFGYDFQAAGEFALVLSTADDLAVQVRQEPWPGSSVVSINTAVAMTVAGDRVGVYVGAEPPLRINGAPMTLESGSLPLPAGGLVEREGAYYTIIWPDQSEVAVGVSDQYLDLIVRLAATRTGQVAGLLGNADGDPANDFATRDGTVVALSGQLETDRYRQLYGQFGRSWRISRDESLFEVGRLGGPGPDLQQVEAIAYAQPGFPTALMPSALIEASDLPPEVQQAAEALCRQAGVVAADFLADCVLDVGLTGEAAFAASAAEIEAMFAPAPADSALARLRGYEFSGPLSPRGANEWEYRAMNHLSDTTSGTLYLRIGIDPENPNNPEYAVRELVANLKLQGTGDDGSCSFEWTTDDVPYSVWKQPDHLVILADGVKAMSCNGEPEKVEDFTVQFQLYVINESTLALCEEPIFDPRGDCVANPAAVLVEVPRTP